MNDESVLEIEPGRLEMTELEETECLFNQQDALVVALTVSAVAIAILLCS